MLGETVGLVLRVLLVRVGDWLVVRWICFTRAFVDFVHFLGGVPVDTNLSCSV